MRTHFILITFFILILIVIAASPLARAADAETLLKLDKALQTAATYRYGSNADALRQIEDIVVATATAPQSRNEIEKRLISTLERTDSTDAKGFLCRQLRTIGTSRSVPALEKLLPDPDVSHMARYVLGRMTDPAATAALLRGLDATTGKLKIGVINTLGEKGDEKSVFKLIHFLNSTDDDLAAAAAVAIGKIGGFIAANALTSARIEASKKLLPHIDTALLACADGLVADRAEIMAISIYQRFYAADQPVHLRIAALRGLLSAESSDTTTLIREAMKAPELRASAINFARDAKGKNATRILTDVLPSLPPDAQELLITALSERKDSSARSAVLKSAESEHESVRVAAITALGSVGDSSVVRLLIERATHRTGNEQRAARDSLARLDDPAVNATLTQSLDSNRTEERVETIRALARRKATSATERLLTLAGDANVDTRLAALGALGLLASERHLPALLNLVLTAKDSDSLDAIEKAVESTFRRIPGNDSNTALVLATLERAKPAAQPTLLRLLGQTPTVAGLKAVRASLKNDNPMIQDAAIRTLVAWPDPAPAAAVLELIRSAPGETQRVLALRGYVRMAGLSENSTEMYIQAMDLATRPEDKKLVLAGLGGAASWQALELVQNHIKDPGLQTEAGLAAVQILGNIRQTDPERARAALNEIVTVEDKNLRQQARKILNEMDQYQGYILNWLAAGPYQFKDKDGEALFSMKLPPETPNAANVTWTPVIKGIDAWSINLESAFRNDDHIAAFLKTRVWSPKNQSAQLELGSDDAVKAWLNGELIHGKWTIRGLAARQDTVKVSLKEGWNDILLKVVDQEGGWAFCCRLRNPDGGPLDDIRISTD